MQWNGFESNWVWFELPRTLFNLATLSLIHCLLPCYLHHCFLFISLTSKSSNKIKKYRDTGTIRYNEIVNSESRVCLWSQPNYFFVSPFISSLVVAIFTQRPHKSIRLNLFLTHDWKLLRISNMYTSSPPCTQVFTATDKVIATVIVITGVLYYCYYQVNAGCEKNSCSHQYRQVIVIFIKKIPYRILFPRCKRAM